MIKERYNVLMVTHQLSRSLYGGLEVQMDRLIDGINVVNQGFTAKLFEPSHDKISEFDIIHIFNPSAFPYESLKISEYTKEIGKKLVISSVFFLNDDFDKINQKSLRSQIGKKSVLSFRNIIRKFPDVDPYSYFERILNMADLIMPNTTEESNLLNSLFNANPEKIRVIPNGVENRFYNKADRSFIEEYSISEPYILFVGRIEKRKNVLGLIDAFNQLNLGCQLVIVGQPTDYNYYTRCKSLGDKKVRFLPPIDHESPLLHSAYSCCSVFVLPSYYETPGIAALEAAASGARVVITRNGGTFEYFGSNGYYVDPSSIEDIKKMIGLAFLDSQTKENFVVSGMERFSWQSISKRTIEAYKKIM